MSIESRHTGLVPAVTRASAILGRLAAAGHPQSLTELAVALELPKSSVLGICRTLVAAGLVDRDRATGGYRLGPQILSLSQAYLRSLDVAAEFLQVVEQVPELHAETVQLALPDGAAVVYVARRDGTARIGFPRLGCEIGQRLPASCTAAGRSMLAGRADDGVRALYPEASSLPRLTGRSPATVDDLLADLARVRRRGYAIDDEAVMEGLACVGAAVPGPAGGEPIAAVSVVLLKAWLNRAAERRLAGAVRETADRLSARMGRGRA